MRMLVAAGAAVDTVDAAAEVNDVAAPLSALSGSVSRAEPMFSVRDLPATVRWYQSLGFTCTDAYEDDGAVTFARLVFGRCSFALTPGGATPSGVSLWVFTSTIDEIYRLVRARQWHAARAALSGEPGGLECRFDEDLYTPFYGGRQFSLRDPNDLSVIFYQPESTE